MCGVKRGGLFSSHHPVRLTALLLTDDLAAGESQDIRMPSPVFVQVVKDLPLLGFDGGRLEQPFRVVEPGGAFSLKLKATGISPFRVLGARSKNAATSARVMPTKFVPRPQRPEQPTRNGKSSKQGNIFVISTTL